MMINMSHTGHDDDVEPPGHNNPAEHAIIINQHMSSIHAMMLYDG